MPAEVNLWELITTVGSKPDLPNSSKCQAIQAMHSQRYISELSLEILDNGNWLITAFDHEDRSNAQIILCIWPDGRVSVERNRKLNDVYESRTLSF